MRPFELVVVTILAIASAAISVSRTSRRMRLLRQLAITAGIAVVAQLWLESFRWQFAPIHALFMLTCGMYCYRHMTTSHKDREVASSTVSAIVGIVFGAVALLLLSGGIVLMTVMPVVNLPEPTGPFAVGTTYVEFVDSSRSETRTDGPDDVRRFAARVWYPAELGGNTDRASYRDRPPPVGAIVPGPPDFVFSHLHLSRSNSFEDAPIARRETAYPVVLFSVGFLAGHDDHQLTMEELASHGYVVFSFTNPYESASVVLPDGTVVPFSAEHATGYRQHMETITPLWEEFWVREDTAATYEIARRILESETFMDAVLRTRVADIRFAVDELERMNAVGTGEVFAGKLDLSRLGAAGHSMGGAVAGQLCLVDGRVKAGVNLDGYQFGDVANGKIRKPFMTMYSEPFAGANDFILGNFSDTNYVLTIAGSTHMNFSDWPVVLPITRRLGMAGSIEPVRAASITNDYLREFFDKHLSGATAQLLASTRSPYHEVRMEMLVP